VPGPPGARAPARGSRVRSESCSESHTMKSWCALKARRVLEVVGRGPAFLLHRQVIIKRHRPGEPSAFKQGCAGGQPFLAGS
jgi:hypothetical protein